YRRFCAATGRKMPPAPNHNVDWQHADHPMVNVTWADIQSYCVWAGVALPTEAQWEKAARGIDGRLYPWGDKMDSRKCHRIESALIGLAPVGHYPSGASPYGCLDMAGNVWERCADWYAEDYYQQGEDHNPTGPAEGTVRVLRGGSWGYYQAGLFRTTDR